MTDFRSITLDGNTPTEQGERAMGLVFERLTGKCWHRMGKAIAPGTRACEKCGEEFGLSGPYNPALLTSLDAWRPLLNALPTDVFFRVNKRVKARGKLPDEPTELLEDVMLELEDTCPECQGRGFIMFGRMLHDGYEHKDPCTCNNGKISLYTIWEGECDE